MSVRGADERTGGAVVGGASGAVVKAGRLTIVVGDPAEPFTSDDIPRAAMAMAESLAADGGWQFDAVAAALQEFVVAHGPAGVAALIDSGSDPMVFLFDRAEAVELDIDQEPRESDRRLQGIGRSGWTTELVAGPFIHLRLGTEPVVGWTSLDSGVVVGCSATIELSTVPLEALSVETRADEAPTVEAPIDADEPFSEYPVADDASPVEPSSGEPVPGVEASEPPPVEPVEELAVRTAALPADGSGQASSGDGAAEEPVLEAGPPASSIIEDTADLDKATLEDAMEPESEHEGVDGVSPTETVVVDPSLIGVTKLDGSLEAAADPPPPGGIVNPPPPGGPVPKPPSQGDQPLPPPGGFPTPPAPSDPLLPPPAAGWPPQAATPSNLAPLPPPADQPPPPVSGFSSVPAGQPPPPPTDAPTQPPAPGTQPPPPADAPTQPPAPGTQPPPPADAPPQPPAPGTQPPPPADAPPQPPAPSAQPPPPADAPPQPPAPSAQPPPPADAPASEAPPQPPAPASPDGGPAATEPMPPPPSGRLGQPLAEIANTPVPPPSPGPQPAGEARGRVASSPIVAYLIEDDAAGTMHPIVSTAVVGSGPDQDPEVVIGAATMIKIRDPSVHEVHVRIKVRDRQVTVEDAGFGDSWLQSGGGPMRAIQGAGEQILLPGSQIRLGTRTLVFRNASGPGS